MQNAIRQRVIGLILILFAAVILVKFPVFLEVVINSCTHLCGPSPEKPHDDTILFLILLVTLIPCVL